MFPTKEFSEKIFLHYNYVLLSVSCYGSGLMRQFRADLSCPEVYLVNICLRSLNKQRFYLFYFELHLIYAIFADRTNQTT